MRSTLKPYITKAIVVLAKRRFVGQEILLVPNNPYHLYVMHVVWSNSPYISSLKVEMSKIKKTNFKSVKIATKYFCKVALSIDKLVPRRQNLIH